MPAWGWVLVGLAVVWMFRGGGHGCCGGHSGHGSHNHDDMDEPRPEN